MVSDCTGLLTISRPTLFLRAKRGYVTVVTYPLSGFVALLARLHSVVKCQAAALHLQGFFLARLSNKS